MRKRLLIIFILCLCISVSACKKAVPPENTPTSTESTDSSTTTTTTTTQQQEPPESTHTHSYSEWTTSKVATCIATGEKTRKCDCGATEAQTLDKVAHTVVIDKAITPSCTKTGLTEGKHCSACNTIIVKQETIAQSEHSWTNATCTAPKTCSQCGTTSGQVLPHDLNSTDNKCKNCGVFEYTPEFAVKGAMKSVVYALNGTMDYYTIENIYYVPSEKCLCDECAAGTDMGEPYIHMVVFFDGISNQKRLTYALMAGIHKKYDPESDTYHTLALCFDRDYDINYSGNELLEIYAYDYSFYFGQKDLILLPKSSVLG